MTSASSKVKKARSKSSSKSSAKEREKRTDTVRKDSAKVPQLTSTPAEVFQPTVANITGHVPVITPAPNR